MDEFTVFEKTFDKTNDVDGFFIKLTCSEDNELQYVRVDSITLNESLGLMIPTMIIDFVDGSGDLFNHNRLNTEAVYTLYFGLDKIEAKETKFKIFDIQMGGGTAGRSNNMKFKVLFSHESWEDTTAQKKSRGWHDKKFSDAITDIINTKGFKEVNIEESTRTIQFINQLNQADNKFISSIRTKATPISEDGHYVFCGTLDNRFFFRSTYELIQDGMKLNKEKKMPVLRLGGQPSNNVRDKLYENNDNTPISFSGFGASESYADKVSNGASAVNVGYYDWANRRYVRARKHYSDLKSTQLSEYSLMRTGNDYVSKNVFGGRDDTVIDVEMNRLSEISLEMQDITINLQGQLGMHSGDIVEVIIPSTEDSETPYNEMYSGFYMVRDIKHMMTLNKATDFISQIKLTRNGMDGKNLEGYVKSKRGKVDAR